ncbi:class I adenylate-forming enzyme family protein [Phaeacidiphilus oryzae]|uniref:class I adenylate-forming enzyme family protein n=1 Tax=Phaeacidiphilus oryzae TaxID=348818 RepID=UPI00056A222A|nr:class I adenylate-forming enzyme family protein [Phaeacidiphilus oryzae]
MSLAALTAPGSPFHTTETAVGGRRVPVYGPGPGVPEHLGQLLAATRAHGDKPFLVGPRGGYGYAGHYAAAADLARRMVEGYGLRKGDRVAIAMRNHPEWQVAFWACQLAGTVAVPLNAWWSAEELARALDHCSPRLLVADGERVPRLAPWRERQDAAERPWLLTVADEAEPAGEKADGRRERFEDLPGGPGTPPEVGLSADDLAAIIYTSGTTGEPKGVVLTHRNIVGAALNGRWAGVRAAVEAGVDILADPPAITAMVTFPFFHVAAFTGVLTAMTAGSTVVLLHKWDVEAARDAIAANGVTAFAGVPTTALQLLHGSADDPRLATLSVVNTGGAAAPPELVRLIEERFGDRVEPRNGYGLTETVGGVISIAGDRYRKHPDAVGAPSPATRIRIVGADGAECPDGEIGELQITGQSVFGGYWNNPEATEAAFDRGWFRTGDLACVRDGELCIVDRIKDVVIRGGENVYCVEVESVLFAHPDVADAAVVGIPHPQLGEEVAALVVAKDGRPLDPEEVRAFVAARLAGFKVPALVVPRGRPLPRNATGKVLKRELREELSRSRGEAR